MRGEGARRSAIDCEEASVKRVRLLARFLIGTVLAVGLFWWGTSRVTKDADHDRPKEDEPRL